MTAKEFIGMALDTNVIVGDKKTGLFIKNKEEYENRNVVDFYAKAHRCGNHPKMRAEIVVFVR